MSFASTDQRPQSTNEGTTEMNTKGRVLLVLSCVLLGILGCRKECASQKTSVKTVDTCEVKIQEAFRRPSDWRFCHGDNIIYNDTMSMLHGALTRLNDPTQRRNYINRLADIVFAYPLDATDPGPEVFYYPLDPSTLGTRSEQRLRQRNPSSSCGRKSARRNKT